VRAVRASAATNPHRMAAERVVPFPHQLR
jgi:hypothetical protein